MKCIQPPFSVYLDDEREAPPGWIWVKTASDAIAMIGTGLIHRVSLDHDLGLEHETGYDVILYMEHCANYYSAFRPPQMFAHTANAGARRKMELGIRAVYKIWKTKKKNV